MNDHYVIRYPQWHLLYLYLPTLPSLTAPAKRQGLWKAATSRGMLSKLMSDPCRERIVPSLAFVTTHEMIHITCLKLSNIGFSIACGEL